MRTTVTIQNIKCDGCKDAVTKRMLSVEGISNISIDLTSQRVSFDYSTHNTMEGLRAELAEMGYPITTDPNRIGVTGAT